MSNVRRIHGPHAFLDTQFFAGLDGGRRDAAEVGWAISAHTPAEDGRTSEGAASAARFFADGSPVDSEPANQSTDTTLTLGLLFG